ncbi:nickel-dependent hydrogenase large subunit, partial [Turicimonas muris]
MANQKIVVDPITRIEGHLRMQAVMDDNNVIVDAMSTGTMWRGLEVILKGRDPRDAWAFVERICGVCTGIHALSAVRAVEDALGIKIPKNANIIRNLMNATLYCQDHLTHFYQLHGLDWIDVVSALNADPKKTSEIQVAISNHALSSPAYFKEIQDRLKKFVASGQLGIFANAYWGNPAYKLPPEVNLLGVTHYLESLDYQRQIVKVHTILGGKNPHPNYLVGGVPCPINMNDTGAQGTMVNQIWVNYIRDIAKDTIKFIEEVYYPDLMAMAPFYKDWFKIGGGLSNQNLLCYGDFPRYANDLSEKSLLMPNGAIIDGKLDEIHPVDLKDPNQIKEFVDHSWYQYPQPDAGLHPWDGITDPKFELGAGTEGTKTDIKWLGAESRYSWIKAPRWNGHAMETGPLAR